MERIETASPPRVPSNLGGRWIAWNHERSKIVANGTTLAEARAAARLAGEARPFLTKAPDPNVRFVGGLR
ncbi:MAG: hypothetical protein AABP62_00590 [Planctomycetota bacterium]